VRRRTLRASCSEDLKKIVDAAKPPIGERWAPQIEASRRRPSTAVFTAAG